MRILLVNAQGADLTAGGSGRYVADLRRGLGRRGCAVHVLAGFPVREDGAERTTTTLHSSHWRQSRTRRWRNHLGDVVARPSSGLRRAVADANPELVHTNALPGFSTAVWEVAHELGLPVVHTLHDYHLLCPRASLTQRDGSPCCPHRSFCSLRTRRLARWAPLVSDVISGSEHLVERVGRLFPDARFHVVRLPLAPLADRPLRPPALPPRTIGYIGGLDPIKGVHELVAGTPELARLGLRVRLAGDGRLRAEVETTGTIEYVGPVLGTEKIAFIEDADIGICPSTWEEANGPNYVVAEWVSAGRPVLCSTRGGLAEAQGLPGVVAIEPSPAGIVTGAQRLVDSWQAVVSQLVPVTGTQDLERWLDEHEAVYDRAVAARRPRTSA